ncbi:MAG: FAD-binding protein [Acidobacteriota bacterium]
MLKRLLRGAVLDSPEELEARSSDFGRMIHHTPLAVVRPAETQDVARTLRFAAEHGLKVSTRGEAHTQSGQALVQGGIVLDLTSLNRILEVDPEGATVTCEGGAVWRDLVTRLEPHGLQPPVLTNNLGVTVGGTLSVAGLGISSFRYGTQADQVLELEVVTGEGKRLSASAGKNRDLFDATRAGLGQCGIITRARLRLRAVKPMTRTFYLLYDRLEAFLADTGALINENRFDYLEAWCVPCPQGFRKVDGAPRPFAEWFFPLHATVEMDEGEQPDAGRLLAGLSFHRHVHTEDRPILEFAQRLEPLFALWKQSGYWGAAHPWMETILPWNRAGAFLSQVLPNLSPALLGGGHILLWPSRGGTSSVPLFRHPTTDLVLGFGILPGYPPQAVPQAVPQLNKLSDASIAAGASRYLSGLIQFDRPRWLAHFGDIWPRFVEWKRRFDPGRILNPGFIPFD